MSRIWYCRTCGYEVKSRGRCHSCKEKLIPSALPELPPGPEEDEVGYQIDGWGGSDRGELIVRLNDLGIPHRFEDEELVVDASDEVRVDDLLAVLGDLLSDLRSPRRAGFDLAETPGGTENQDADADDGPDADIDGGPGSSDGLDEQGSRASSRLEGDEHGAESLGDGTEGDEDELSEHPEVAAAIDLLSDAVARLCKDPTDMQADADVAEASAWVFTVERYGLFDEQEWAAIGRVTRRLLSLLGADEALEEEISTEAAVLQRLLVTPARPDETVSADNSGPVDLTAVDSDDPSQAGGFIRSERTVYELPDWLPDQRAQLEVRLAQGGIEFEWDGDDLLVPADREDEVDGIFDQILGTDDDDDADEDRYQALTELFAATGRLAADPTDLDRRDAARQWADRVGGAPLLGMDEIDWFRIMSKLRGLVAAMNDEGGDDFETVGLLAGEMHELLRSVV